MSLINFSSIKTQLNTWKVLPQPERLTELYFNDHTKLPVIYSIDQQQTVLFTVHNLEYQPMTYSYTINQINPSNHERRVLSVGKIYLENGEAEKKSSVISPVDLGVKTIIDVNLRAAGVDESIHYIVNKVAS